MTDPPRAKSLRFGVFEVDLGAGELRKSGRKLRIRNQPFQVLSILLARAGELVTREELIEALWPDGTIVEFDHSVNTSIREIREALGDSATNPRFIQTVPRRGYRFLADLVQAPRTISSGQRIKLAVLPFDDLGSDKEREWFADGMTDAIMTNLAGARALRVTSRSSVIRFKGTTKSLPEIAAELDVSYLLEGSLIRVRDHVRITARLIEATEDRHLWAGSYDGNMNEILTLQNTVAQEIARQVQVELRTDETNRYSLVRKVHPEAYDFYLRGTYLFHKGSYEAGQEVVQCYEQAISLDPGFAQAYAALSDAITLFFALGDAPWREMIPKAKRLATKALQLDPSLAQAHAALGAANAMAWRWTKAEEALQRAIALNPSYSHAHHLYAMLHLAPLGRLDEALSQMKRARELDPLSLFHKFMQGSIHVRRREYGRAIDLVKEAIDADPGDSTPFLLLGAAHLGLQNYDSAVAALDKYRSVASTARGLGLLGCALVRCGRLNNAEQIIEELRERAKRGRRSALSIGLVLLFQGDKEQAFEYFEAAYAEREFWLPYLKVDPWCDSIRADPRYATLLRKMNLEP